MRIVTTFAPHRSIVGVDSFPGPWVPLIPRGKKDCHEQNTAKPTPPKLDDAEQQHLMNGLAHLLRTGWHVRIMVDQDLKELDLLMNPPIRPTKAEE